MKKMLSLLSEHPFLCKHQSDRDHLCIGNLLERREEEFLTDSQIGVARLNRIKPPFRWLSLNGWKAADTYIGIAIRLILSFLLHKQLYLDIISGQMNDMYKWPQRCSS